MERYVIPLGVLKRCRALSSMVIFSRSILRRNPGKLSPTTPYRNTSSVLYDSSQSCWVRSLVRSIPWVDWVGWNSIRLLVHNGKDYVLVVVTQDMVGHKLGEFSHTKKRFIYRCVVLPLRY
jgi:ribosomal protein S19